MEENKNVPEIRFEDFTGEWEEVKLGELADIFDGTHQTPNYQNEGVKFVSVENINSLKTNKYISYEDFLKEYSAKMPSKGDVLMTRIGDIGTTNIVKNNEPLAYYVTLALLKPKETHGVFLSYGINSEKAQKELWKYTLHIAFPKKINLGEISKVNIFIPSVKEQQAIGQYFEKLDSLITLHQEKHQKLLDLKKAMLYKLFPKEGGTVPEIRFEGFTGEWGEVLIEDLFDVTRGQVLSTEQIKKNKTSNFKYPVYSSQTVNKGLLGYYNKYLFENAITWTTDGANAGDTNYRKGKFYCTNVCGVLINNEGYANYCIAAILNSVSRKHVSYVGNPKLMNNVVKKIKLIIPSLKEQQAIGQYFSKLDEIIDLNKEKIDKLKHIKDALLDKMFV